MKAAAGACGNSETSVAGVPAGASLVVVAGPADVTAWIVTALRPVRERYAVKALHPNSPAKLLHGLQRDDPRIAVLDVELCQSLGVDAMHGLRAAVPLMLWVAGWARPTVGALEVLVDARMHGAIAWSDSCARLTQAFDAVRAGELWFPRTVMQVLYETVSTQCNVSALWSAPEAAAILTLRQGEVIALARKGLTNKAIAKQLKICPDTVKKHLSSAFDKLHVGKRRQVLS